MAVTWPAVIISKHRETKLIPPTHSITAQQWDAGTVADAYHPSLNTKNQQYEFNSQTEILIIYSKPILQETPT